MTTPTTTNAPVPVHVTNGGFSVNMTGQTQDMRVKVVEFDMSFFRLVTFMVKIAFAALPAMIILILASMFFTAMLGVLLLAR